MYSYLIVNLIFIAVAAVVFILLKGTISYKRILIVMAGLLVLTAIFDSILIYFNLFGYASNRILGIYLWLAPVEDFAYPVVAAIMVPLLWERSKKWFQG